jgi:hypothetical protein
MTTKTPPVPDRRLTESDWLVIQAAREWRSARDNACSMRLDPIADSVEALVDATDLWEGDERFRESQEADERRMQRTGDTRI